MKKLMIAAVTAAVAGGAFALPHVYDYKASVKHLYLKEIPVSYKDDDGKTVSKKVYQKYQTTTSLKGYLIMDQDGVTSPTINSAAGWNDDYQLEYNGAERKFGGTDYGRNRGFLVVINNKAYKTVRHPKILPAILDAKWLDTNFKKAGTALNGLAEGTLYVGGDAIKPVRPQIDLLDELTSRTRAHDVPEADTIVTYDPTKEVDKVTVTPPQNGPKPGMVAIADYVWTSVYLFAGTTKDDAFFNGPNWFYRQDDAKIAATKNSPFGVFEYAWDKTLPYYLMTGWIRMNDDAGNYFNKGTTIDNKFTVNYYHDTWMNGAGVGKWFTKNNKDDGEYCCGIVDEGYDYNDPRTLESLSGNLKGGLFLCTENGIIAGSTTYQWYRGIEWEDQFNTARLTPAAFFSADVWQNDLWQDGFMEQETTDVIYGTWSIKWNTSLLTKKTKGKPEDLPKYGTQTFADHWGFVGTITPEYHPGRALVNETLWKALYLAAWDLDHDVNFYDGTEIHNKTVANRADLPMITPQFALYYRLLINYILN